ncbi:uncharacterized protein LOC130753447 isoform X3 [Actinidia eriantha]|uniref:uncharacterized protein LOC130753447 isoform X3 n=1 Tax=Actinidia eriantha TaxID=165200 RepID=UPI00258E1C52|nr:uncharacterized protein LOC130753447 isoform X3 [Actinidia eriantha]
MEEDLLQLLEVEEEEWAQLGEEPLLEAGPKAEAGAGVDQAVSLRFHRQGNGEPVENVLEALRGSYGFAWVKQRILSFSQLPGKTNVQIYQAFVRVRSGGRRNFVEEAKLYIFNEFFGGPWPPTAPGTATARTEC